MMQGFGITGYRSFGPDPQYLFPLGKVNLIAGRNNAGKSNVLRAIQLFAKYSQQHKQFLPPTGLDAHLGTRSARFSWRLPIVIDEEGLSGLIKTLFRDEGQRREWAPLVRSILGTFPGATADTVWIKHEYSDIWKPELPDASKTLRAVSQSGIKVHDLQGTWYRMWSALTNRTGGSFEQHHGPEVLASLVARAVPSVANVHLLSAHRQIGTPGTTYEGLDGQGLIARLLELQNPELEVRTQSLEKFAKINRFLSEVLEAEDARLEVPHSGRELNVSIRGRVLPIESLGTGVQEVIIFAAAATSLDNEIVCIEEPEIHLHPRMQRQLIQYLQSQTTNQYVIATHSACLLDAPGASVFHVRLNGHDETEVQRLGLASHRAGAVFDLGYRASDLIQANAIIWVEGPSDRIYLNAWIASVDPNLEEGLHYSIMFYGGRLLAHLSADDSSVTKFIALQRLNRQVAMVLDSDRRKARDPLNSTKTRVLDEIEKVGGFGWVTAGREIENYIATATLREALNEAHPNTQFKPTKSQWDCCYEAIGKKAHSVDKVAVARTAIAAVDLEVLDLRAKVEGLVRYLQLANQ